METRNYVAKAIGYIRNLRTKRNSTSGVVNELIHPRFGITTNLKNGKHNADSLTFLMYSKENENLFI